MKGMFVKDMEIMRGNMKTFIGVYIIAIFCFLSTSAGPSFLISYVSVLAAVMALNTIASDDMDNGMPYIFTFPISRIREGEVSAGCRDGHGIVGCCCCNCNWRKCFRIS